MMSRSLGGCNLSISALGLGTWALGGGEGSMQRTSTSDDNGLAAIHRAVELGVNWIDTAPIYGDGRAEKLVGSALAKLPPADRPLVFTKCGLRLDADATPTVDLRVEQLRADCEASLDRLGVDQIDLLQVHWPGDDADALCAAWQALEDLRLAGKARAIGVSNFSARQLDACGAIAPIASHQIPLSLIERRRAPDFADADRDGIGGLAYSALQSGLLSGRFRRTELRAGDWRRDAPVQFSHQLNFREPALGRNLALADRLNAIAAEAGLSAVETAVGWTLAWPGVTGTIVGARDASHVEGWIRAGDAGLDVGTLDALAEALHETGAGSGPLIPPAAAK